MTPSPGRMHQKISLKLAKKLDDFVAEKKLGEVYEAPFDIVLSEEDIVQPDLLFVSKENLGRMTENNFQGAPDLVVEITSQGTANRDRIIKRKLYGRYGVREYWIVDPDAKTIEVIGWQGSDFTTLQTYPQGSTLKSPLLEGFLLKLSDLFQPND